MSKLLAFLFLLVLQFDLAYARTIEVDVVFSSHHRSHLKLAQALKLKLWADDVRFFPAYENGDLQEEEEQLKLIQRRHPNLLVLIGEDALQAYRQLRGLGKIPAISLMAMTLPATSSSRPSYLCGIDLRPEPLILAQGLKQSAHSRIKKVFTFYAPDQATTYIQKAKHAFHEAGIRLEAMPWPDRGSEAWLFKRVESYDAYWMQMEKRSVAPDFVRALAELARRGKHIIAISPKYLRAGMDLALYLDVDRLAQDAIDYINRVLIENEGACGAVVHSNAIRLSWEKTLNNETN